MRQRGQAVMQDQATDTELACRAGAGDLEAFETLYRRHVEAAWRMALAVTANPDDAADAVSDAFTRVFQALPDRLHAADYFLPYLLAAVRNAAIDVLRRGRLRASDPREEHDWSALGSEPAELMVAGADAALMARAFRSLPERWRSVLWLTEVEGIPAREAAGLLGVSANGVAQLAVRARAGLRQRYLQAHLRETEVRSLCRQTVDRLGAYAAGGLAPRDISKVDQHLAACETCRSRLAQLEDMAPGLRRAVLPLPAGLAALVMGKWRLGPSTSAATSAGPSAGATSPVGGPGATAATATGAGAAAPVGVGVGAAAVGVPASIVTSVASIALLVAGIVGVNIVDHGAGRSAEVATATAPQASFRAAAAAGGGGEAAGDPVATLVAEGTQAATEVPGLPATIPEVAPPGPGEISGIATGNLGLDVQALPVSGDVNEGAGACRLIVVLGARIGCPVGGPPPAAPPAPEVETGAPAPTETARNIDEAPAETPEQTEQTEPVPVSEDVESDGQVPEAGAAGGR